MRGEPVRESLSEKVTFECKLEEGKTGRAKTADFCVKSISRQSNKSQGLEVQMFSTV